ncbi:hypothetical protein [Rhodococcus rhodochrous]|nr:hypothetical protein [Rhodococcus rhodochrous]
MTATSVGALTGTLEWQVDMLVTSAECGRSAILPPNRPSTPTLSR